MVRLYRTLESGYFENYSAYLEAQADFDKLQAKLGDDYFNKWMEIKDKIGDKIKDPDWVRTSPEEPVKFIPNPDRKFKNIYDILRYNDEEIEELKKFLDNFQSKASKTKKQKVDGAEEIYNKGGWLVYRITKYPAAQYYGSHTKWCITGRYDGQEEKGEYYFNKYIREADLDGGYYFYIRNSDQEKFCVLRTKNGDINSIWNAEDKEITESDLPNDFPSVPISGLEDLSYIDAFEVAVKSIKEDNIKRLSKAIETALQRSSADGEIEVTLSGLLNIALEENPSIIPQIVKLFIIYSKSSSSFYEMWMDDLLSFIEHLIKEGSSNESYMEVLDNVLKALEIDYEQAVEKFFINLYNIADKSIIPRIVKSFGTYLNFDSNTVYNELLIRAIEHNDIETIRELFNYDTDQNYEDENGKSVLAYAIESKNKDIVKLLLDCDADADTSYDDIQEALLNTTQEIKDLISDYTKENNMLERKTYINELDFVEEGLFSTKYDAEDGKEFIEKLKSSLGPTLNNMLKISNPRNREFYVNIFPKEAFSERGDKDTIIDGYFVISGKDSRNMYIAAYHGMPDNRNEQRPFKSIQKLDLKDLRLIRGFIQTNLKEMLKNR